MYVTCISRLSVLSLVWVGLGLGLGFRWQGPGDPFSPEFRSFEVSVFGGC